MSCGCGCGCGECKCDGIMSSRTKKLYLFVLVMVVIVSIMSYFDRPPKKYVVAVHPWCPYVCMESHDNLTLNSERPGFLVEVFKAFAAHEDLQVEYKSYIWHEAIRDLYRGKVDVLLGMTKEEAGKTATNSIPVATQELCFWSSVKNKWKYSGPKDLKAHSKLLIERDVSVDFLRDVILQKNIELILSDFVASRDLIYKLAIGVYDLALVVEDAFLEDLATVKDGKRIVENKGCVFTHDVFNAFGDKVDKKLITQFDKFYADFVKTKEYEDIMKRYPKVKLK